MTKPFHPGAAARAGLMSALLAKNGFTASPRAIEAPRGYAQVVSTKCDWSEITRGLGETFEISLNTYKPFACGIVIHPTIDAASQLRAQGVKPGDVERVELKVHPLVLELTGKKDPQDGLQGKFSIYQGFVLGLFFGRAGETEYTDEIVRRADVVELRRKVVATATEGLEEDAADVTVTLKDGRSAHVHVEHAIGSLAKPMSDADLEAKFHGLVDPILGKVKAAGLHQLCPHDRERGGRACTLRRSPPMSARPKVVVLDDYERSLRKTADWSPVEAKADVKVYHERLKGEALMSAIQDADAIVVVRDRTPFKADLIAKLPKLKAFIFTGARNSQYDAAAMAQRGNPGRQHRDGRLQGQHHGDHLEPHPRCRQAPRSLHGPGAQGRVARRQGTSGHAFGPAPRRHRPGQHRRARGAGGQGVRHGSRDVEPAHDGRARGEGRREIGEPRGAALDLESGQRCTSCRRRRRAS